jgi:hypothetical protein
MWLFFSFKIWWLLVLSFPPKNSALVQFALVFIEICHKKDTGWGCHQTYVYQNKTKQWTVFKQCLMSKSASLMSIGIWSCFCKGIFCVREGQVRGGLCSVLGGYLRCHICRFEFWFGRTKLELGLIFKIETKTESDLLKKNWNIYVWNWN